MPFADELIGVQTAEGLARAIDGTMPGVPLPHLRAAPTKLDGRALRQRADLLRDALLADLPGGHESLLHVVRSARHSEPSLSGWMLWPVTAAVATKGVPTVLRRHSMTRCMRWPSPPGC